MFDRKLIRKIKERHKENVINNLHDNEKHVVLKESEPVKDDIMIIPESENIIDYPVLFNNENNNDIKRLINDLTEYWEELKNKYSENHQQINNVDFYIVDSFKDIQKIIKINTKYFGDNHDVLDLIENMRCQYKRYERSDYKNYIDIGATFFTNIYGITDSGPIVSVSGLLNDVYQLFIILKDFIDYDKILEIFKVEILHEMGHVLHIFDLFEDYNVYDAKTIFYDELKETNKLVKEYYESNTEYGIVFDEFYHTRCPSEIEADAAVNLSIDYIKYIFGIIHDCVEKQYNI